jgi:hypothetical protein
MNNFRGPMPASPIEIGKSGGERRARYPHLEVLVAGPVWKPHPVIADTDGAVETIAAEKTMVNMAEATLGPLRLIADIGNSLLVIRPPQVLVL